MSDEESPDRAYEPTVSTAHQDERVKRFLPQAIPPRAPVPPTAAEKRQIQAATKAVAAKPSPVEVRVGQDEHCRPVVGLPHTDEAGWRDQMRAAFGTASGAFVEAEFDRLLTILRASRDDLPLETKMNAALAVIQSIAPKNEVEAMLAVQIAMTHPAVMRMISELDRYSALGNPGSVAVVGNISAKLLRAFAGQVEALAKLRRPADQVVRVERVNISPGGQAIVGNVTHTPSRRGGNQAEDQPHGTQYPGAFEPASDPSLRSQTAGWLALPEAASQRTDPVQAPRRRVRQRRSKG